MRRALLNYLARQLLQHRTDNATLLSLHGRATAYHGKQAPRAATAGGNL